MRDIHLDRFHEIMSRVPGDGRTLLNEMHTTIFLQGPSTGNFVW